LRYGVIHTEDLVRDLLYWETLLVSSMMQRPIRKIIDTEGIVKQGEIWGNYQRKNLKSALAYAALTTQPGKTERDLYESIIEIPQYDYKWL
jgi:hypothetical protein